METLRTYLNSLTPAEQSSFAIRCGTTIAYLRKALSVKPELGGSICINIERESNRKVRCEDLRPDVDWQFLRGTTG